VAAACWLSTGVRAQHGGVVHLPADKMSPLIEKGGNVARLPDASVAINRRTGRGQSEVHDKETDTFYILEGDATFVTGGKVLGGRTTAAGQIRGTGIDGGETMQLHKGDVVVVPAGTPHWFKDVPSRIVYYTVKAIRP
jgi:mannose-6-phosphate isomerase-like protein (cupin superfamily)